MSIVPIEIFNIARTTVDREAVRKWLDHIGADDWEIPSSTDLTDPALLVALAAKRCYMSFEVGLNPNITRVRSDLVAYLDNILASGHGSVLEHSVYTFALEGVSRVFTAEMNRHRAGWAISEGSLRFIRFDKDIPWWLPTCLKGNPKDDTDLDLRKHKTRVVFIRAFRQMMENYAECLEIWDMKEGHHNFSYKKKMTSCFRRIIGLGVATGGVWTGNLRALRHVIALRANEPMAEEEIFHVFSRIGEIMVEREKALFGDFSQETGSGFQNTQKYRNSWRWEALGAIKTAFPMSEYPPKTRIEPRASGGQSAWMSALEAKANLAFAFGISWEINTYVMPRIFHVTLSKSQAFWWTVIFTILSFIRQFFLRRLFNAIQLRRK